MDQNETLFNERRRPILCSNCSRPMVHMNKYVINDNKNIYMWYICPRRKGENGCGHKIAVGLEKISNQEASTAERQSTLRDKLEAALKRAYNELNSQLAKRSAELLSPLIGEGICKFDSLAFHHKQIEKRLNETEELLREVLSDTHSLIAYLDIKFNFIQVNQAYAQADGRTREFFIGRNYFELYPDEDIRLSFQRVIETSESYSIYAKPLGNIQHSEREAIYWDWTIHPVKDISGRLEGLMLCLVNVEELKGLGEKSILERRELAGPSHLSEIGAFVATVAHELRNPLGVIRTAVYNIKRKGQHPSLYKHLANIEKKLSESEHIINNLLSFSHLKKPHYEKIPIYNILDECIASAQKRFPKQKVSIDKKIKAIEKTFIEADPFQMVEIFNNILDNTYQSVADKKGEIEIMAKVEGRVILISFKDNGTGIDKENFKKIFEPFFTTKSKGTGLGLTICNELVSLHGGKIDIESEKDKGTTVTVTLPIERIKND